MAADSITHIYLNAFEPPHPALYVHIYTNIGTGLPPQRLPGQLVYPPPVHIPHKEWATGTEAQNYYTVERWSYIMSQATFPSGFLLHIPYRHWSNPHEEANYNALERWALQVQTQGYKIPLHFPFKKWAYEEYDADAAHLEEDNYRHLEWWALQWIGYPGAAVAGVPPIYPNIHMHIYENVI